MDAENSNAPFGTGSRPGGAREPRSRAALKPLAVALVVALAGFGGVGGAFARDDSGSRGNNGKASDHGDRGGGNPKGQDKRGTEEQPEQRAPESEPVLEIQSAPEPVAEVVETAPVVEPAPVAELVEIAPVAEPAPVVEPDPVVEIPVPDVDPVVNGPVPAPDTEGLPKPAASWTS